MKRKAQKNIYIATLANGEMVTITAPNAKTAKIVALNSADPVVGLSRTFKRGGEIGNEILGKMQIGLAKCEYYLNEMNKA